MTSEDDRQSQWAYTTITDLANDILVAAPADNMQVFVDGVYVTNGHATVDTVVEFKQGTTSVGFAHYAAADGGGFGFNFIKSPLKWGGGNSLEVANATDSSSTHIQLAYHMGPT